MSKSDILYYTVKRTVDNDERVTRYIKVYVISESDFGGDIGKKLRLVLRNKFDTIDCKKPPEQFLMDNLTLYGENDKIIPPNEILLEEIK